MTSTQAAQLQALYNNMTNGGDLLALNCCNHTNGTVIKAGLPYFNSSYVSSIVQNSATDIIITFCKDCNIQLLQSLNNGTTWTQVDVTLNGNNIISKKHTTNPVVWQDILYLSIKSGDVLNVVYTYSNIAYVSGVTVITLS